MVEMSHGLRSYGVYFHVFIPLDFHRLQLSRLFNSPILHRYSYKPGSHYLLSNQSNRTVYCTINLLPRLRSHYFYYLCKCFKLLPGTALILVITF